MRYRHAHSTFIKGRFTTLSFIKCVHQLHLREGLLGKKKINVDMRIIREIARETDRERDRQTDIQTYIQTD